MNKTNVLVIVMLLLSVLSVSATGNHCEKCVGKNSYSNGFCSHFKNENSCTHGQAKQFCKWKSFACPPDDDDDEEQDPCENLHCQYGCTEGHCNPPPGTDPCLSLTCEFGCSNGHCNPAPEPNPSTEPAQEPINTDKPKKTGNGDSGIYLGGFEGRCLKFMTLQLRQGAVYKGYYFDTFKKHHLVNLVVTQVTPFPTMEIDGQETLLLDTGRYFDYDGDRRIDGRIKLVKEFGGGVIIEIQKAC